MYNKNSTRLVQVLAKLDLKAKKEKLQNLFCEVCMYSVCFTHNKKQIMTWTYCNHAIHIYTCRYSKYTFLNTVTVVPFKFILFKSSIQ